MFSFLDGRWHLTDAVQKYGVWEEALGNRDLAHRLFSVALNLAEGRRGGLFVILDDRRKAHELLSNAAICFTSQHEAARRPDRRISFITYCEARE